jgi:Pyrroloquinoline quinone (Coenzyme PQQ) biosynthesis protein C
MALRPSLRWPFLLWELQPMLEILQFKLDVLWSMLDAMSMAYELQRLPYHSVTRDNVWHRGIIL